MQFAAVGEERIRLLFEAAQKGKKLDSPGVRRELEQEAVSAGIALAQSRIAALEQLQSSSDNPLQSNAE